MRVRASEPHPGRTVFEYLVPESSIAGNVLALIYRSQDSVYQAASCTHTFTDPPTVLDVSTGSTRGGIVVTVTTFAFFIERDSALKVLFGNTAALLVRDSMVFSSGKTTFSLVVPPRSAASTVQVSIKSQVGSEATGMLFEYFEAPQVISMAPTSGFAGVPTAIRLVIARFPVVTSAAQLSVQIGVGLDVVPGVSELLSSEPASTEILVVTLSERLTFLISHRCRLRSRSLLL
jgi:hypothetical protein